MPGLHILTTHTHTPYIYTYHTYIHSPHIHTPHTHIIPHTHTLHTYISACFLSSESNHESKLTFLAPITERHKGMLHEQ